MTKQKTTGSFGAVPDDSTGAGAPEGEDYRSLDLVQALPAGPFFPQDGSDLCRKLVGATILGFGSPRNGNLEGGGLIIDFALPSAPTENFRVVFGFNSEGLWVEYDGRR